MDGFVLLSVNGECA